MKLVFIIICIIFLMLFGIVMVYACCKASGIASRMEEEMQKDREKENDSNE